MSVCILPFPKTVISHSKEGTGRNSLTNFINFFLFFGPFPHKLNNLSQGCDKLLMSLTHELATCLLVAFGLWRVSKD